MDLILVAALVRFAENFLLLLLLFFADILHDYAILILILKLGLKLQTLVDKGLGFFFILRGILVVLLVLRLLLLNMLWFREICVAVVSIGESLDLFGPFYHLFIV